MLKRVRWTWAAGVFVCAAARAQAPADMHAVIERLDRLEAENRRLSAEVAELRGQIAAAAPPAGETTDAAHQSEQAEVEENRTAELDQKKVESASKMPLELTGMLLFNAFANGSHSGTSTYPTTAAQLGGPDSTGATLRQTILGLKFHGPDLPWGGNASGSLYMDFFAGTSDPENNLLHLRVAKLDLNWSNTTITFGQDKPIISPREPDSLAQVGLSPLTGAGNLWDWRPQARIEQRFVLSDAARIAVQGGVYETEESNRTVPTEYASTLHPQPGYQGRVEFSYAGRNSRYEIAPGYHASTTHVAGQSVESRIVSLDGLARLSSRIELTGEWFHGQNVAGLGAESEGFTILPSGAAVAVHAAGGWGQITITPAPRWSFHLYSGEQSNRGPDLYGSGILRNFVYAGNVMWKLAPNVVAAFELSQTRTNYLISGLRLNNHYDLALAYLF